MLLAEKTLLKSKIEEGVLKNRIRSKQYYDRVSRQLPELSEGRT